MRMKKSVFLLYILDGLWAFYWSILASLWPKIYGICVLLIYLQHVVTFTVTNTVAL